MYRVVFSGFALLLSVSALGCVGDPYSQRRIVLRQESFAETIRGIRHREDSGYGRVERAQRAVEQWGRQDEIEFAEDLEQIGDHAW